MENTDLRAIFLKLSEIWSALACIECEFLIQNKKKNIFQKFVLNMYLLISIFIDNFVSGKSAACGDQKCNCDILPFEIETRVEADSRKKVVAK